MNPTTQLSNAKHGESALPSWSFWRRAENSREQRVNAIAEHRQREKLSACSQIVIRNQSTVRAQPSPCSLRLISEALSLYSSLACIVTLAIAATQLHAQQPPRDEVLRTLDRAAAFMQQATSMHGGYVYAYSGDLKLREGEGVTDQHTIWIQPPGTPLVGEAFLAVYAATQHEAVLKCAHAAALALAQRQLHSGGWYYSAHFEGPEADNKYYCHDLNWNAQPDPVPAKAKAADTGWDDWKMRRYEANLTTLDDNTTQSVLRFLMRTQQALGANKDEHLEQAIQRGLTALLHTQYPNGAWSTNWDRLPDQPPSAACYPVKPAAYPDDYPRKWPKDFTGCYVLNDDLISDCIHTLLVAAESYKDARYLDAAKKAGDFFILAQMPEPQPAWAQQYDKDMHPVWGRAFEVAAISSRESETTLEALLMLARATGDKKWLAPIPKALAYLRKSLRPDGTLARYYELRSNTPLYFQRVKGGGHELTTSDANPSSNYGSILQPILDDIEAEYQRLTTQPIIIGSQRPIKESPAELAKAAQEIIASMDERGAWVEHGAHMKHNKVNPASGVIFSETFAKNVETLCHYLGLGYRAPLSQ
jgi:Pectic acid lyase